MSRRPDGAGFGLVALARFACRIFFRSIEIEGAAGVPRDRPLVVVANHVNGLVDPALLLASLSVVPRFLGKSTLWKMPALRPFLAWAGVIPVYRRQDAGLPGGLVANAAATPAPEGNDATFAACHSHLAAGGSIALFPEGISHSLPALAPLKTGAARIALEAELRHGREGRPLGVQIVPVGLVWENKGEFRSRVLVNVGAPLDPAAELAAYRAALSTAPATTSQATDTQPADSEKGALDPGAAAAVRQLTARIDEALRAETLNFTSHHEGKLLARAAELVARRSSRLPALPGLAANFDVAKAVIAGHQQARGGAAGELANEVQALTREVERYERLLAFFGLRDAQVTATYPLGLVARWVLASLLRLLVLLPLALFGTLTNLLPYHLVGVIARRYGAELDQQATWKLLPALVVFPAAWLGVGLAAGWAMGWATGVGLALLAAGSGWVALLFHERRARLWREARAFLMLRRGRLQGELVRRRDEISDRLLALAERLATPNSASGG